MSARHDRIVRMLTNIRYKTIGFMLVAMFFACALIGIISSKVCWGASYPGRTQIAYCTVALTALTPFPGEEYKRATLYAMRGIARADLGQTEAARRDLHIALVKATFGQPGLVLKNTGIRDMWKSVPISLLERMARLDPQSPAAQIWAELLAPYQPITLRVRRTR